MYRAPGACGPRQGGDVVITLWLGLALADTGCLSPPSTDSVAVAWVSPLRQRVGAATMIDVVPAADLRRLDLQTVGELAHAVGLRKKKTTPRRPYKVTIFEVQAHMVCRPLEGVEPGERVAGVAACEQPRTRGSSDGSGCLEGDALQVFRIRWRDAVSRGFCVLPAQRFIEEGQR